MLSCFRFRIRGCIGPSRLNGQLGFSGSEPEVSVGSWTPDSAWRDVGAWGLML